MLPGRQSPGASEEGAVFSVVANGLPLPKTAWAWLLFGCGLLFLGGVWSIWLGLKMAGGVWGEGGAPPPRANKVLSHQKAKKCEQQSYDGIKT